MKVTEGIENSAIVRAVLPDGSKFMGSNYYYYSEGNEELIPQDEKLLFYKFDFTTWNQVIEVKVNGTTLHLDNFQSDNRYGHIHSFVVVTPNARFRWGGKHF